MRIANGEHREIKLVPEDTVVFLLRLFRQRKNCARLKDTLFRKGAEVVHYQMMDVHASVRQSRRRQANDSLACSKIFCPYPRQSFPFTL